MIQVRKSADRGHANHGWLDSHHTFSFADYHDPAHVQFSVLRVINEDRVAPGAGFPTHGHRDMEIVSYVLDGALEHKDSMGNGSIIRPGDVQRMSAGTGVRHSEYNASKEKPLHLVQLWILPAVKNLPPSWEQQRFPLEARTGKLLPIAVPADHTEKQPAGVVRIHQDATIYTSLLRPGDSATHALAAGRRAYLFLIAGELQVNNETLHAGDQARITSERAINLAAPAGSAKDAATADFLLLDLP